MTTTFHDAHLDTLMKLKALAEKHGMKIRFGTKNNHSNDIDTDILNNFDVKQEFIDLLGNDDYIDIQEIINGDMNYSYECIWFELYEPPKNKEDKGKYHVMSYEQNHVNFWLHNDWQDDLDGAITETKPYMGENDTRSMERIKTIEALKEWLQEQNAEYNMISLNNAPTRIRGFGNEQPIVDGRVYRDGMALHYFTELVCEYLKEPMIYNTY